MTYQVQLKVFAGPLDLLLHLIEHAELDIYDIPIAMITEQFLEYLHAMELLNLEIAGEFIVMAATLMQIKAKMLLPKPIVQEDAAEEEDPRRELVDRLIEYKRVKEAASLLRQCEEGQAKFYARIAGDFADQQIDGVDNPVNGLGLWDLLDAFHNVLAALEPDDTRVPMPAEEISVKQIMTGLLAALQAAGGELDFKEAFAGHNTRLKLITAFIALLELIRLGRVMAVQKGVFGRIVLRMGRNQEVPT